MLRYLGVDLVQRDRAVARHAELLEIGDHDAGVLVRDVSEDQVTRRVKNGTSEQDDVTDRVRALEQLQHMIGLALPRDDPQVDHAASVPRRPKTSDVPDTVITVVSRARRMSADREAAGSEHAAQPPPSCIRRGPGAQSLFWRRLPQ